MKFCNHKNVSNVNLILNLLTIVNYNEDGLINQLHKYIISRFS